MGEFLRDGPTRHVMEVDPVSIGDLREHESSACYASDCTVQYAGKTNERLTA